MNKFEANLLEVLPRTFDVSSFRFNNPMKIDFKAGQYFFVTISKGDSVLTHHFSMSNSPTENDYLEFTTRLRDTEFKNALKQLRVGDKVQIKAPFGDFLLDENLSKIVMISGGIGITPMRSMIKYSIDRHLGLNIILLYSNKTEKDIAFRDELEVMQQENSWLRVIHTLTRADSSWKGRAGHVNQAMISDEIPDYADRVFYISGPPAMVDSIDTLVQEMGIKKEKIRKEIFAGY